MKLLENPHVVLIVEAWSFVDHTTGHNDLIRQLNRLTLLHPKTVATTVDAALGMMLVFPDGSVDEKIKKRLNFDTQISLAEQRLKALKLQQELKKVAE